MSATELPPPPPPPPPPPAVEPEKPSWWKRKLWKFPVWAWLVAAFIVIGTIGNLTEKDKEDEAASSVSPTASAPPTTQPTAPPTTPPTTPPTAPPTTPPTAPPTEAPTTSVQVMIAWGQVNGGLLQATIEEMDNATAALADLDLAEAERASRVVSGNMSIMAKSLENETDPGAVASRNAFNSCSVAYDAAAQSISDIDSEGILAASSLIDGCGSAMKTATDTINAG